MNGEIKDHGSAFHEDIPWAGRQLWDCDVVCKDGKYYMYFPLKDQNDIFQHQGSCKVINLMVLLFWK